MTIQLTEVRSLVDLPSEMSISFGDVFKAAGIQPPASGWTVDHLMEFLDTEQIRRLDRTAAQRAILSKLQADGVDAADVERRHLQDHALDAFADSVSRKGSARWPTRSGRFRGSKNKSPMRKRSGTTGGKS